MKHIIAIIFSLISITCFAQISFLHAGMPGVFSPPSVLTLPDGGYIKIKKENAKNKGRSWNSYTVIVTVFKYDKDFKLTNQVQLPGANIYSGRYTELRKIGSKYWLIYLEGQDNDTVGDIKAIEINPATLAITEPKVVAPSTLLNYTIKSAIRAYQLHFLTRSSPSDKYVCLYVRLAGNEFYISCLDENLNRKWSKKESIEFGGTEAGTGLCSLEVDDAGTVYFGYTVKSGPGYFIYSPAGKSVSKSVNLPEASAKEILFNTEKNTGKVYVYGTYKEHDNCKGVFKGELNAKGEITSVIKTLFPPSVLEPLDKEGWANTREKKYGIHPKFNAFLTTLDDGSVSLLAEFYLAIPTSVNHAGSVLYARFNNSGASFGRAPKYWAGYGFPEYIFDGEYEQGSYYYAYPYGSKMILFYFDNPKNISRDISLDAEVLKPSNQILIAAIVDPDGNIKRQVITPMPINYLSTTGTTVPAGTIQIPLVIDNNDVLVNVNTQ